MLKKRIGVFIPNIHKVGYHNHLNYLGKKAAEYGFDMLCFSSYTDLFCNDSFDEGEKSIYYLAEEAGLSAFIIYTELIKDEDLVMYLVKYANRHNIPVFAIEKKMPGAYNISFDYTSAFETIVSHVIEVHGAKNIYMMSGIKGNSFSNERNAAYRRSLEKHGIEFDESKIYYGGFWDEPTKHALDEIIERCGYDNLPDAIVCANDTMAVCTCTYLEGRNIIVPDDIIVTGFDGIDRGQNNYPSISSAKNNYQSAGDFIIGEINRITNGGKIEICDLVFDLNFLKGQSCGCVDASRHSSAKVTAYLYDTINQREEFKNSMDHMMLVNNRNENIYEVFPKLEKYVKSILYCGTAIYIYPKFFGYDIPGKVLAAYVNPSDTSYHTPFDDTGTDDLFPTDIFAECPTFYFVPLHCQDRVYGYVVLAGTDMNFLAFDRLSDFAVHMNMLLSGMENAAKLNELVNTLNEMYIRDPLTNLYNRRGFDRELETLLLKSKSAGKNVMMISVDLDGLKFINDSFGHSEGDYAISTVANALRKASEGHGISARFGGDEFIAAVEEFTTIEEFEELFARNLADANKISGKKYSVTASIGIVVTDPDEILESSKDVIKRADARMYKYKKKNKLLQGFKYAK